MAVSPAAQTFIFSGDTSKEITGLQNTHLMSIELDSSWDDTDDITFKYKTRPDGTAVTIYRDNDGQFKIEAANYTAPCIIEFTRPLGPFMDITLVSSGSQTGTTVIPRFSILRGL